MKVAGLSAGAAEQAQWGCRERPVDFFDMKGDVELLLAPRQPRFVAAQHPAFHPGRSARVELDGVAIGFVGELHPKWRQAYELPQAPVLFEVDLEPVLDVRVPVYESVSRQQPVYRDLSLVVADTVSHDSLVASLRADPTRLVRNVLLFDVYKPTSEGSGVSMGERSLAIRLELLDDEETLNDLRIDAAVQSALARAQQAVGARLRS